MKITEFRKLIREEVRRVLKEGSGDLLSKLQDYISADYTADQGYEDAMVNKAEQDMKRIEAEITKLKGKPYFEALKEFASLTTYDSEFAGAEESTEIKPKLEKYAKMLGFTIEDLHGHN